MSVTLDSRCFGDLWRHVGVAEVGTGGPGYQCFRVRPLAQSGAHGSGSVSGPTKRLRVVFEDGAYCAVEPDIIIETLERLLRAASESGHTVDLVYCGQTGAESTGDVLACNGGCAPHQCCCGGHRLVRTKHAYGSFSYLLRRSKIETVCQFLDPRAIVYTSDGALKKSVAKGLVAVHFEEEGARCNLIAHRPPSETGGSRIRPS